MFEPAAYLLGIETVKPKTRHDGATTLGKIAQIGLGERPAHERDRVDQVRRRRLDRLEDLHEQSGVLGIIPGRANIDRVVLVPVVRGIAPRHAVDPPAEVGHGIETQVVVSNEITRIFHHEISAALHAPHHNGVLTSSQRILLPNPSQTSTGPKSRDRTLSSI